MKRAGGGMWRAPLVLLAAAAQAAGCGGDPGAHRTAPSPGLRAATLTVDTLERGFTVYVPRSPRSRPGVVLVLHGGAGGSGARIRGFVGAELEALAEEEGFLVAYPDGLAGSWNDCRADAAYGAKMRRVDDVGFVRELIRHLARSYGADPDRVFAMGYSNGGHLAYRLAIEMPDAVRGIAAFGANLPAPDGFDCREPTAPVRVMIVNGTADPINPYGGGDVVAPDGTTLGAVRSAGETLAYFGRLAGHAGEPVRSAVVGARDAVVGVERRAWSRRGRADVVLYTVRRGGHVIPSPSARFPDFLGRVERRFAAVVEAVRFFGLARRGLRVAAGGPDPWPGRPAAAQAAGVRVPATSG